MDERRVTDEGHSALEALQQLSRQLALPDSMQILYGYLMDAAMLVMDSDFTSVQRLDSATGELELLDTKGFTVEVSSFWQRVGPNSASTCGQALRTGTRCVVPDVERCEFMAGTRELTMYREGDVRAVQSTPLISRDGHVMGMISTHWKRPHQPRQRDLGLLDIVARQAADLIEGSRKDKALRDSEERYRRLIEALPAAVYVTDAQGLLQLYNEAAVELWGRRPTIGQDRWCGSYGIYALNGKRVPLDQCPMARVLHEGRSVKGEEVLIERPDGTRRHVLPYPDPIFDASGALTGAINMLVDITELRKGEEARARLASIVESSDDAIISKDTNGIITSWNGGAQRLFGYTAQEAIGQSVTMLMPPDRVNEEPGILARIRRGERIDHYESVRRRSDGTLLNVSLTISPIADARGVVVGASKIARDITQRRRYEAQLMELNKTLERRVAKRTSQLQALAHQLTQVEWKERTRLARSLHDGLQQLLVAATFRLRKLESNINTDSEKNAVKQINELLCQSIEMSRSLTMQLSPPILHERGLAAGLAWLTRWMHDRHAMEVTLDAAPDAEPESEEVRLLLFEAARELLFNVAKHAGTHCATMSLDRLDRQWVRIVITDQGAGFDPDHIPRSDEELTGFGLMSIRERLGYVGGNMEIKSQLGQGAQMTLIAPRCQTSRLRSLLFSNGKPGQAGGDAASRRKAAVKRSDALQRPIRVLLADDHQILREGLAGLLEDEPNIEVIGEASDGVVAVEMALRLKPDVVVMDITMPHMDGIEATRRIKEKEPGIRIVGLSMHAKKDLGHALREAGGEAYITKGGPAEDLIDAIRGG